MASEPLPWISPEQYLELDRAAERRSEYVDGRIYAMAGASPAHMMIVNNVAVDLTIQTRGRCRVFTNDFRLFVPQRTSYFYPDIVVICGGIEIAGDHDDVFTNPSVLIEVISKSSGNYDRAVKFSHYRTIPSLDDYLVIDQYRPLAEHYSRQPDGGWLFHEYSSLEDAIRIMSLAAELTMAEIYRDIEFAGERPGAPQ